MHDLLQICDSSENDGNPFLDSDWPKSYGVRPKMAEKPLTVVWISDYPIEWMPDLPAALRPLPRRHPATWMMVLLAEFEKDPTLRIHVVVLRHRVAEGMSFQRNGVPFHVLNAPPWMRLAS